MPSIPQSPTSRAALHRLTDLATERASVAAVLEGRGVDVREEDALGHLQTMHRALAAYDRAAGLAAAAGRSIGALPARGGSERLLAYAQRVLDDAVVPEAAIRAGAMPGGATDGRPARGGSEFSVLALAAQAVRALGTGRPATAEPSAPQDPASLVADVKRAIAEQPDAARVVFRGADLTRLQQGLLRNAGALGPVVRDEPETDVFSRVFTPSVDVHTLVQDVPPVAAPTPVIAPVRRPLR